MAHTPQHHSPRPVPYDGWALDVAVRLDRAHPGFLARSFASSSLKRQTHFAAFAAILQDNPADLAERLRRVAPPHVVVNSSDPLAQIAHHLLALRARRVLEALYGSCPRGLVGILGRVGALPFNPGPDLYRVLWSFFACPEHRERAKLLMETPDLIPARRIRVLSLLDGILLRRSVLDRVGNPAEVFSLQEAVRLIQTLVPQATTERLAQSLDDLGPRTSSRRSQAQDLSAFSLGWLEEMQHAPVDGPFEPDDLEFRLLVGKALVDAGRRYRNCLNSHLGHVAAGRKLFYEWRGEPGAIIELNCLSDALGHTYYAAGQIRGTGNTRPPVHSLAQIRARLREAGVLFTGSATGPKVPLGVLLDLFDDDEPYHARVSFLDTLEELPEPIVTRAA